MGKDSIPSKNLNVLGGFRGDDIEYIKSYLRLYRPTGGKKISNLITTTVLFIMAPLQIYEVLKGEVYVRKTTVNSETRYVII